MTNEFGAEWSSRIFYNKTAYFLSLFVRSLVPFSLGHISLGRVVSNICGINVCCAVCLLQRAYIFDVMCVPQNLFLSPSIPVDSGSFFHPHIPHISVFFSYTTFSTRRRSLQMYVYNHQTSHADKLEALKTLHRTSILARESSKFHKNWNCSSSRQQWKDQIERFDSQDDEHTQDALRFSPVSSYVLCGSLVPWLSMSCR